MTSGISVFKPCLDVFDAGLDLGRRQMVLVGNRLGRHRSDFEHSFSKRENSPQLAGRASMRNPL
ncbi:MULTISPECIES: hypothetical protein [unclassified Mesorhizobium]|uniref:hypothetical protein n=1 Tax=unclassified Mesorhizobium TaxID=325217 RepID=UPI0013DF4571|nr:MULTISPECIES: hypothetical protein [unclassified Mesorhizobium]